MTVKMEMFDRIRPPSFHGVIMARRYSGAIIEFVLMGKYRCSGHHDNDNQPEFSTP